MFFGPKRFAAGERKFLIQNRQTTWFGDLLVRLASGLLILYLLWTGWTQFGPQKPRADFVRTTAADVAARQIGDVLRVKRQDIKSLTLLNFADEPTNLISDALRQHLGSSGAFLLADRPFFDKLRRGLNMTQSAVAEPETALRLGHRNNSDAVLYGTVQRFETVEGRAVIHIDYHLVDCKSGDTVYSGEYDNRADTPSSAIGASLASIPAAVSGLATVTGGGLLSRFLGWLLIVLLLPMFTIRFLMIMMEKRSNMINAFVLGTYTCVGAILAWILLVPNRESSLSFVLFGLLCCVVCWYNIQIMTFAVKQNETARP